MSVPNDAAIASTVDSPGSLRADPSALRGRSRGTPVAPPATAAPVPAPAGPIVPERPQLATGIDLVGEMVESAFRTPPWLISRNGRFLQVSRLLYAVAEHCDGRHTLDEIAPVVSEEIKRDVQPEHVAIIVGNLMKSGIVAPPDGVEPVEIAPAAGASPLGLRLRMRMLSPRVIDPVTAVVQIFYWPPVVVLFLAAAAIAEVWLYVAHGVGAGIHEAFYTPGLMVVVFGLVVLSAGIHELGHAAALRYGGGKVRGMGVGLYVVYPAFYTDVTDNYRLPRWSRVRTDLGGFYFNLLVILALMAIYAATGQEFLLLVVVVLNLEIIHQTLPFIRLDGYWTLADLTGIPDFFSQIAPFLRTHLPGWVPLPEGPKLAELKTWGKLVFGLYILVTIPLLLFLSFVMLRTAPRLVATALDAIGHQVGVVGNAAAAGPILALAAVIQIVALALPLIGLVFTIGTVFRRIFMAIWRWSEPTPQRRVAGVLASAALLGFVAFLWAPQLPFVGGSGPLYAVTAPFTPIAENDSLSAADILSGASGAGGTGTSSSGPSASRNPNGSPQASGQPAASGLVPPSALPGTIGGAPGSTTVPAGATPAPTLAGTPAPTSTATIPSATPGSASVAPSGALTCPAAGTTSPAPSGCP